MPMIGRHFCAAPVILFDAWRQLGHPLAEILATAPSPDIEKQVPRGSGGSNLCTTANAAAAAPNPQSPRRRSDRESFTFFLLILPRSSHLQP